MRSGFDGTLSKSVVVKQEKKSDKLLEEVRKSLTAPGLRLPGVLHGDPTDRILAATARIALRGCHRTYSDRNESRIRTTDVIPL
jgi:PIN domain nuclease of toxin-antitoxin system